MPEDWRLTRGYKYQPVRMSGLREKNQVLEVHCNDCSHSVEIDAKTLPFGDDLPVPEAKRFFKCSRCGSKSITTRPQVYPDRTVAESHARAQDKQRSGQGGW